MSHMKGAAANNLFVPRSRLYQSPFGRLFPKLEPWRSPESTEANIKAALQDFADTAMSEPAGAPVFDNPNLPAGYTYFGQFVDHDITFDPTSSLQRQNDPNKLHNFRTPRLDLDCVYGSGPADQPYLYDSKQKGMLLTHNVIVETGDGARPTVMFEPDLARNHQGRALIGDMRNDENLIVSQIQLALIILHNRVYAKLHGADDLDSLDDEFELDMDLFKEAQRIVRWFYQYVVWNDFIKRIIPESVFERLLEKDIDSEHRNYNARFFKWKHYPFMPVEFSVAAYRFGHSLIRPGYQINDIVGFGVEKAIFNPDGSRTNDLSGFKDREANHTIQWDWFLQFPSSGGPFPQASRKIDVQLSESVFKVPEGPDQPNLLAFLNLLRSFRMDLPTGTSVAHAMGLPAHAIGDPHEDILWHYILKESELLPEIRRGQQLGLVGGTIVGEVFAGLLAGDGMSYINCFPAWDPSLESALPFDEPLRPANGWDLADLIRAAGMPVTAANVLDFVNNGIPSVPYGL